ncbi:MAG: hypothetical protein LBV16_03330 [Elusimicrobiota bacterium]|jgi:hypothetical protein|nr:hypothetical protein [Elusimicrobiota bacterium]
MKKLFLLLFLALSIFGIIYVISEQEVTEEEVIEMARNQKGRLDLNKIEGDTVEEQIIGLDASRRKLAIQQMENTYAYPYTPEYLAWYIVYKDPCQII